MAHQTKAEREDIYWLYVLEQSYLAHLSTVMEMCLYCPIWWPLATHDYWVFDMWLLHIWYVMEELSFLNCILINLNLI